MAETDVFPVAPDYVFSRTREPNVAEFQAASREAFRRTTAPLRRVFDLSFGQRAVADWTAIENFRLEHRDSFFTFVDVTQGDRDFSCLFLGEPRYDEIGFERVNIRLQLIEAAGVALRTYPSTPLINLPTSEGVDVGDGIIFVYPGYGFKITGSGVTDIELDGVSIGATLQKFDVPLLLHQLKVKPNTASLTKFEFVH